MANEIKRVCGAFGDKGQGFQHGKKAHATREKSFDWESSGGAPVGHALFFIFFPSSLSFDPRQLVAGERKKPLTPKPFFFFALS